jgi:hypothetical protein
MVHADAAGIHAIRGLEEVMKWRLVFINPNPICPNHLI